MGEGGFILHRAVTKFVERKSWVARTRERGKERGAEIDRARKGKSEREGEGGGGVGGREGGRNREIEKRNERATEK